MQWCKTLLVHMSENNLFSGITHIWFQPCVKFSLTSSNHTSRVGLIFDPVNWRILVVSDLGQKNKRLLWSGEAKWIIILNLL